MMDETEHPSDSELFPVDEVVTTVTTADDQPVRAPILPAISLIAAEGAPDTPIKQEPLLSPQPKTPAARNPKDDDDTSGIRAVQTGLWNLWNTNTQLLTSAVSEVKSTAETAMSQVASQPVVQMAMRKAHEATEKVGLIVDKTRTAGMAAVGITDDCGPNVVLTSATFCKVNAVRSGVARVFGDASNFKAVPVGSDIAPQPVGFEAAKLGAENRIRNLRKLDTNLEGSIIISIESTIVEVFPGSWYDIPLVLLVDDANAIRIEIPGQGTPVPLKFVDAAKEQTPENYEHADTGLSVTCGEMMKEAEPSVDDHDWHHSVISLSRESLLHVAALVVLGKYRTTLEAMEPISS